MILKCIYVYENSQNIRSLCHRISNIKWPGVLCRDFLSLSLNTASAVCDILLSPMNSILKSEESMWECIVNWCGSSKGLVKQSSSEGVVDCAANILYYRFLKRFLFCHCFDNVNIARKQSTFSTAGHQWQSCMIWCDRKCLVCSKKLMDEIFIFHNVEYEYFIHMDQKQTEEK